MNRGAGESAGMVAGPIRSWGDCSIPECWGVPVDAMLGRLGITSHGLSPREAGRRLSDSASRLHRAGRATRALSVLPGQFASPIVLTLLVAALSYSLRDATNALIIPVIVLIRGVLGF